MPPLLRKIDHVTCVVRPETIKQWAWFYVDVLGGVLTLRTDDTNPDGDSSMMVWTVDFAEFGVALIAGIDRKEKSHVTAFAEKHGDHSFQHVAFQVPSLEVFCSKAATYGVNLLGDTLVRKDPTGRYIKQVFGSPFHDEENSSLVAFYEFVERPRPKRDGEPDANPEISFSEKAGTILYQQAQREMAEDRPGRRRMTRFSKMPPTWQPPEPQPDRAGLGAVEVVKRRGRREHDHVEVIGEIQRWQSYRGANARFPTARAAELGEMQRLVDAKPGETIAEVGAGQGALTYPMARAVGPNGRVFTYDISRDNLVAVMLSNETGLPIIPVPQSVVEHAEKFPNRGEVDCVATLATFHHFDSRLVPGTRGRQAAVDAFARLLKRGGRLVVGDVAANTPPQRYFDAIDNPRYCSPNGHPHDFLTGSELAEMCRTAGFVDIGFEVKQVPWVFDSKQLASEFMAAMHNAQCPLEEVHELAERHLAFDESPGRCLLRWELLFLTARKE